MTELIFDLDGRAITISIIAPEEEAATGHADDAPEAPWLLHARWDEQDGSRAGTAAIHAGASLEDFSHQGLARIVRRIMKTQ
ncbi:MAG TPA: hypothetical protein VMN60_02435 [Longimicrobiales bacterium]|nr:hypothetical protein [Longimicrobiales bacterium]